MLTCVPCFTKEQKAVMEFATTGARAGLEASGTTEPANVEVGLAALRVIEES